MSALDADDENVVSPPYSAVIECAPADNEDVVSVAVAGIPESISVAITVEPCINVTVPVGTPFTGDAALTVAVKVTA
jgi:hypothetical protein